MGEATAAHRPCPLPKHAPGRTPPRPGHGIYSGCPLTGALHGFGVVGKGLWRPRTAPEPRLGGSLRAVVPSGFSATRAAPRILPRPTPPRDGSAPVARAHAPP